MACERRTGQEEEEGWVRGEEGRKVHISQARGWGQYGAMPPLTCTHMLLPPPVPPPWRYGLSTRAIEPPLVPTPPPSPPAEWRCDPIMAWLRFRAGEEGNEKECEKGSAGKTMRIRGKACLAVHTWPILYLAALTPHLFHTSHLV